MPQPDHVTALPTEGDEATLDAATRAYFDKCREKLGFVPNVLRAYALRPEKLVRFIATYDELMLAPSGLSKLEHINDYWRIINYGWRRELRQILIFSLTYRKGKRQNTCG